MKWENVKLGEYCEITSSKRIFYSEYVDSGVPFYRSKEIIEKSQGMPISEPLYISQEKYDEINGKFGVPQKGDLLLTSVGTIGVPYIVKRDDYFYFKDGNLTWFRSFSDFLLSKFLFYWIISNEGQGVLNNTTIGSSQKALTIAALKNIEIPLPPRSIQAKIIDILSAYDDLIENNQKQIKLLEEAAQRVYKEWFVDLHFPGYENTPVVDGVPEGWTRVHLSDIISYEIGGGWGNDQATDKYDNPAFVIRGTDLYGLTHGNTFDIPYRYHAKNNLNGRILLDGDIVFEVSGGSKTEGVARTALIRQPILDDFGGAVMCASFCKLVRARYQELSQYLYDTFQYMRLSGKTAEFDKRSASSIVNYRWKDFLEQVEVFLPSTALLNRYNAIAEVLYSSIIAHSRSIIKAAQARDRLLPKLLRGEVEV